jgi:DNA-binding transcriptional LysR family regulator
VSLTAVAGLPFIDFPPGYGLRHETDRGFAGVPRRVAFEVTRVDEVIDFVRKNLGVALLPESVARKRADSDPTLALLPVRGASLKRQVHIVAPDIQRRSAACHAFIRCVEDQRRGARPVDGDVPVSRMKLDGTPTADSGPTALA